MTTKRTIRVFDDNEALAQEAARRLTALAAERTEAGQPFTVALAGGSTPKNLYRLLTTSPYRESLSWENIHFFFGDERCVSPDNENSNYHMVQESLLAALPAPLPDVFRMPADLPDPDIAAQRYEAELIRFFQLEAGQIPRFDLTSARHGGRRSHRLALSTEAGTA